MIKAFNKLLSISLAVLVTLSALSISAYATDNLSLPDRTTPRILTIYKYATVEGSAAETSAQSGTEESTADTTGPAAAASDQKEDLSEDSETKTEAETDTGNGTETEASVVGSEYKPVSNVVFDIYRFADLGDDCPESIAAETAYAWVTANAGRFITSIVTDLNGCASWEAADDRSRDGVYLVVERQSSAVVSTSVIAPFLVALPGTDVTGTAWNYNVSVQPKNLMLDPPSIEKNVVKLDSQQGGVGIGEKFSWIIRSDIPADLYNCDTVNGETFETYAKNYRVSDTLDSRLDYRGGMKVEVAENDKVILTLSDSDYTLAATVKEDAAGGDFSIALEEEGMKHIMQAVSDVSQAELRITFDTSINQTATPGEEVLNNATLDYTNSLNYQYDPIEVTADEVPFVYTGGFKILKVDASDTTKTLTGAEFHIAASEEDAANKNWLRDADGNEIVLTTDQNGTASYRGISYDQESTEPAGGTYYWLVETKAPDGYTLLADPVKFTVNSDSYKDTTTPVTIKDSTAAIAKDSMPLTGNGTASRWWVLAIVLVCVAAIAGGVSLKLRKKHSENESLSR